MAKPKLANTSPQPKVCASKVRVGSKVLPCGKPLSSGTCRSRGSHLMHIMTGFCNSGWHEGLKAKSASGKPAPTCREYLICPCDCHAQLSVMFEMTGKERVLVDNSEYKPERTFTFEDLRPMSGVTVPSIPGVPSTPPTLESPAPGIVPVPVARTFAPTATGRAARGELELWVREVTDIWAVEKDATCTPEYVSREIGRLKGIRPPSTGAVDAVFKRWQKIGFALIETKPTRFMGYTEAGIKMGLEIMKAKAKAGRP